MNDDEKYYRKEWMSDDQWECTKFIADLMAGFNHVQGTFRKWGHGIEINTRHGRLATFDYDGLTRAVVMAHDRCVRFEVQPSGPGMVRLVCHKRHKREGMMSERHPTLEEHVAKIRGTSAPVECGTSEPKPYGCEDGACVFSRSMSQQYPRKCKKCGATEQMSGKGDSDK